MLTTCFPSRSLEFGYLPGIRASVTSPQWTAWEVTFFLCCHKSLLVEFMASRATLLGEDSRCWGLVSPGCFHVSFPFADFILCLFAAVNHSCKYNYMLSPRSSPCESWKWGVGLGPPNSPLIPHLRWTPFTFFTIYYDMSRLLWRSHESTSICGLSQLLFKSKASSVCRVLIKYTVSLCQILSVY